ncbi:ABC transporter ATP-binding protein [Cellulosilyticum sp. ST5]|uniref:ABC transporter ATP-binding protein n=1 Tax=unclassified Cellulosilyticum TaxID=2643091 RepID=UPI0039776F5F
MNTLIEVTNLVKKYGKHTAVNNISFTVKEGEILGFLGPNGAGKSTTMNMLTGYLSSTSGTIKISGIDILENPIEAKKHIGYLPELPPLYVDMTVNDYLVFVAKLKKLPSKDLKTHINEVLERTELTHVQGRLIRNLSKGYKQRVGLASALIGSPDVLILDEPTVGLDPKQIIEMRNLIKELSEKHTIILSSHILPEISAICDSIMIINKGNMVALDTPENLKDLFSHNHLTTLRLRNTDEAFLSALRAIEGVTEVKELDSVEENTVELSLSSNRENDIREKIFEVCVTHHKPLLMMKSEDISLEDIFLKVTNQLNENSTTEDENAQDETSKGSMDEDTNPQEIGIKDMDSKDVNDSEENDTTHLVKEGAIDEDHTR